MQRRTLSVLGGVAAAVLVMSSVACGPGDHPGTGDDDDGTSPDAAGFIDARQNEFTDAGVAEQCTKIDFVFVIDDSGSMAEEQDNLATNFPMFVSVINQYMTDSGQQLDYRIAVTTTGRTNTTTLVYPAPIGPIPTTEQGDDGAFRKECGMTKRWMERSDSSTFTCVAKVGDTGPSYEMPLLMMNWALDKRTADGTNAGFLRDDALLALVILTDEDDCSRLDDNWTIDPLMLPPFDPCAYGDPGLQSVGGFVSFLDNLKGERGRWAAAVIAGQQACTQTGLGDAIEAKRLKEFVQMTGTNGTFGDICTGNLTTALQQALDTFTAACDNFPPVE